MFTGPLNIPFGDVPVQASHPRQCSLGLFDVGSLISRSSLYTFLYISRPRTSLSMPQGVQT